jgi:hypothetical protein
VSIADEYTRSVLTTRHPTVPLDYGCRVEMDSGRFSFPGFIFYVGHVSYGFEAVDREDIVQWRVLRQIRDREEKGIGAEYGCEYPLFGIQPAQAGEGEQHMNLIDFKDKVEAVAFVAAVMKHDVALLSPNFQLAMDACRAFDVSVQDVLEFRREKARRA